MKDNEVPVLLIIFNRPDKVRSLIESLEKIKPKYIYVTGDGPRTGKTGEGNKCDEARKIATNIPWGAEVYTNFSDTNLGCKKGVSTGVTWFFENVEEGIVLEDDCLPHPSFFTLCNQMLTAYKNDESIMHINGTSFLPTLKETVDTPYYFSSIAHSWGWASWRRAWQHFDGEMNNINNLEKSFSKNSLFTKVKYSRYWIKLFKYTKNNKRDSWAVPWSYSVMYANGICITPGVNLVENIGFDEEATHTSGTLNFDLSTSPLPAQLPIQKEITLKKEFDSAVTEKIFMKTIQKRIMLLLERWYNRLISD
jgi:hypothetical protein